VNDPLTQHLDAVLAGVQDQLTRLRDAVRPPGVTVGERAALSVEVDKIAKKLAKLLDALES
jgi:hypothetical protein